MRREITYLWFLWHPLKSVSIVEMAKGLMLRSLMFVSGLSKTRCRLCWYTHCQGIDPCTSLQLLVQGSPSKFASRRVLPPLSTCGERHVSKPAFISLHPGKFCSRTSKTEVKAFVEGELALVQPIIQYKSVRLMGFCTL